MVHDRTAKHHPIDQLDLIVRKIAKHLGIAFPIGHSARQGHSAIKISNNHIIGEKRHMRVEILNIIGVKLALSDL
jgi:hypothetical protein